MRRAGREELCASLHCRGLLSAHEHPSPDPRRIARSAPRPPAGLVLFVCLRLGFRRSDDRTRTELSAMSRFALRMRACAPPEHSVRLSSRAQGDTLVWDSPPVPLARSDFTPGSLAKVTVSGLSESSQKIGLRSVSRPRAAEFLVETLIDSRQARGPRESMSAAPLSITRTGSLIHSLDFSSRSALPFERRFALASRRSRSGSYPEERRGPYEGLARCCFVVSAVALALRSVEASTLTAFLL